MQSVAVSDLVLAARRVGLLLLFGVAPAVGVFAFVALTIGGPHPFFDYDGTLWQAGRAILHGHNPYPVRLLAHLAAVKRAGGSPSLVYAVPLYPAPTLLVFLPLSLLPLRIAGLLVAIGSVAALIAGLRLLGVRDWRCHGAALLSWPVLQSIRLGALDPLLLLGVALLWSSRRQALASAAACAAVATAKVFLWPLGVWLAVVRGWRGVAAGLVVALVACLVGWAIISFAGLGDYAGMLSNVSAVEAAGGSSLIAAGAALGVSHAVAQVVALILTAGLLATAAWIGWSSHDAARSLGLVVVAALTASPVVWAHYLTLAYVPIALLSPELSLLWIVPLLGYLAPVELTHGDIWQILPYLVIELVVTAALVRPSVLGLSPERHAGSSYPLKGRRATVRLPHGLRSTSLRSNIAALRPTKGPQAPY